MTDEPCPHCGVVYQIGDWPFCPHGRVQARGGFEPRFDYGIGKEVTGWGDIKQAMREQKLDFRDHPSTEQRERRRERIFQQTGR